MSLPSGLDSYGPLPISDIGAYHFVARYVSEQPGKCVTKAEIDGYRTAKKSIVLVYEDNATDGLGGANAGAAKARIARPVLADIGWPSDRPVHFAFDMPGYAADLPTFVRCAQAFAEGIGRPPAVYGDVDTCTAAHNAGIKYLWQFGEGRAPGIRILQGPPTTAPWGQAIDPDTALATDYGQWSPVAPKPIPEEDMQFLAKSFNGPATLLYDVGSHTCYGCSASLTATLEKVGIKNYGNTLPKTDLATFRRVG